METCLRTLIEEKGVSVDTPIELDGHFGLTWEMLIQYVGQHPQHHAQIRKTLIVIDFKGGDVFHYLNHLARGMVAAVYGG
jgi:hypothetical protein